MRLLSSILLLVLSTPSWATGSVACFQNCYGQGYEHSQCVTICERNQGVPGLNNQQGAPRNPYLDAVPEPTPGRPGAQNRYYQPQQDVLPYPAPDMRYQGDPRPYQMPGGQPRPPVNLDPRCMDDCRANGHQPGYCRKQCAY